MAHITKATSVKDWFDQRIALSKLWNVLAAQYIKEKPNISIKIHFFTIIYLKLYIFRFLHGTLTVAEPLILKNVDYNVIFLSNFLF